MNSISKKLVLAIISAMALFGVVHAQDREDRDAIAAAAGGMYVVSAKAGGVNYVEGVVTIKRSDGTSGQLTKGEFVEVGDVLTTGQNGRAEILMNPGSFIRLNYNSRFSFASTKLSNLRVNVLAGSAIFEVFASDDFKVTVEAPDSRFYLVKSGVYRIDVQPGGIARLEVWKGRAQTGNASASVIKKGRAATADGNSFDVAKFKRNMDSFEVWSKGRAKQIAKLNRKLSNKNLGPTLISSFQNNRWGCYDSVGLWVFNRAYRNYSFLPFGYGWRSPYGYRLGRSTDMCYYPASYWRYYYPRYPRGGGSGGGGTGGGTNQTVPQANIDRGNRVRTPPFRRMQQTRSVRRSVPRSTFPRSTTRRTTVTRRSNRTTKAPAPAQRRPLGNPSSRTGSKGKVN